MSSNPIFVYWWFHLPNFILAVLMYTLIGRVALGFIFDDSSQNYIWRAFVRLTNPLIRAVSHVTPRSVPQIVVLLFAFVWLFAARIALLWFVANLGFMPSIAGSGS